MARWLLLLGSGALLLAGRFEWQEAGGRFALQGFASSLYFFLLVVPVSYYLTLAASGRRTVARAVCLATFTIACLPYHLVGFSRFRQPVAVTPWNQPGAPPMPPDALAPGLPPAGSPAERPLLLALLVLFALAAAWAAGAQGLRARARRATPAVAALAVIVAQALLHTSFRSPYTYEMLLETPGRQYHVYLLPGGKGAVNADAGLFTSLDEHFNGIPKPVSTMLIRRSFVHYLGSHFTYFFNPFYVYLVLNTLLWLAASAAGDDYVRRVSGSPELGRLFAGLVVAGSGFVHFVAQPMSYLAGYTALVVALWAYELLIVDTTGAVAAGDRAFLYGVVLGLCAATYDLVPLYPTLLLYAGFRRASLKWTAVGIAVASLVGIGFLLLQHGILGLPVDATNSGYVLGAGRGVMAVLGAAAPALLYEQTARFLVVYAQDLVYAFAVAGLVLAAAGVVFVADRRVTVWIALLLLPSLLTIAFFHYGGVRWGRVAFSAIPRLAYSAYPAIYLGAAVALDGARRALARTRLAPAAPYLPWAVLLVLLAYHNSDVFGFRNPQYHFYWPTPIGCDPYAAPASCAEVS